MRNIYIVILLIPLFVLTANEPMKHDGLYLRINLGLGIGYANYEDLFEFKGSTKMYSIHIGSSILENLIIYGKYSFCNMTDPEFKMQDAYVGTFEKTTYEVTGFGGGLTYYLPDNLYLSGSVDFPMVNIQIQDTEGSTGTGFGVELTIGKEIWHNKGWWGGVAFTGQFSGMKDNGEFLNKDIFNSFYAIVISVTFS